MWKQIYSQCFSIHFCLFLKFLWLKKKTQWGSCNIVFQFLLKFFFFSSSRSSQVYYMFGFLFLVFLILVITCSETTILLCYFHLCAEVSDEHFSLFLFFVCINVKISNHDFSKLFKPTIPFPPLCMCRFSKF